MIYVTPDMLKPINVSKNSIVYQYEDDFIKFTLFFSNFNGTKSYSYSCSVWVDNDEGDFVPMEKRDPTIKHSAKYGLWARSFDFEISPKMHLFITRKMIELRWLKKEELL